MKTTVLPVCEKCGKPIGPEVCILVDGALFSIKMATGTIKPYNMVYKIDKQPLVEHFTGSGAYHAACLIKIINEYAFRTALQRISAAAGDRPGTEAKPGRDSTNISITDITTLVQKESLDAINERLEKAGTVFAGIDKAKPGSPDQTAVVTGHLEDDGTAVVDAVKHKKPWGWMDTDDLRRAGKDKPAVPPVPSTEEQLSFEGWYTSWCV